MTTYLGIDLAWGERARTGLAALDAAGRLVASTSVVTDDDIAAFVAAQAAGDVVAAIDAPIVVPNLTGRRDCEAELQREFGRFHAGAHPSNRSRVWLNPPRAERLAERFGWDVDPRVAPGAGRSVAIEVYPHPAIVSLFGLASVLPYKNKPRRTTASRREAFTQLLDGIEQVATTMRLAESARWAEIRAAVDAATRPVDLARMEDEVDAIFCAHLAWLWGQRDERLRVLGNVESGYIVVPIPPVGAQRTVRPSRTPALSAEVLERVAREATARGITPDELVAEALDRMG